MPTQVIMPQLGEAVVEGTVTKWLKAKGQRVEEFEPLLEVNTDKVDTEVPSPAAGVVLEILVAEGATVKAGTLLAQIGEDGESGEVRPSQEPELVSQATPVQSQTLTSTADIPTGRDRDLGFISPVVAKIARENQVDLTQINGTGQGGRITKKDVLDYLEQRASVPGAAPVEATPQTNGQREAPPPPLPASPAPLRSAEVLPGEVVPLSPVRRAIAEHMSFSKRTSPHVTTVMEVNLQRVVSHRQAHKEAFGRDGVNLTFTAYFMAATASALKAYPIVNSSWSDEGLIYHREVNIGMAASLGEAGLIVPVIKRADELSLLGLARAVNDLSTRARARQLKPDEVKGGTFTITNHGTTGSLFATPIINQPQCGILGVGAIQKRVVVIDDAIAIRPMAYLTLTFDHRILDGAVADQFLGKVVELLQQWS